MEKVEEVKKENQNNVKEENGRTREGKWMEKEI